MILTLRQRPDGYPCDCLPPVARPPATITLNDGRALPTLAFGTGTALYGKDASDAVVQALDNGFVHIDCAASKPTVVTCQAASPASL